MLICRPSRLLSWRRQQVSSMVKLVLSGRDGSFIKRSQVTWMARDDSNSAWRPPTWPLKAKCTGRSTAQRWGHLCRWWSQTWLWRTWSRRHCLPSIHHHGFGGDTSMTRAQHRMWDMSNCSNMASARADFYLHIFACFSCKLRRIRAILVPNRRERIPL